MFEIDECGYSWIEFKDVGDENEIRDCVKTKKPLNVTSDQCKNIGYSDYYVALGKIVQDDKETLTVECTIMGGECYKGLLLFSKKYDEQSFVTTL